MEHVRLGFFSPSTVSAVAHRHGFYRHFGLEVQEQPVQSSPGQFESLRDRYFDLVLTAPDNVAAYRFDNNNPLKQRVDACILSAVDAGVGLSVMASADVTSIEDLRGRKVGVDVPTSGFAFVLYAILRQHGLQGGRDLELVTAGATPRRWANLRDGDLDATLLNAGFDAVAEEAGFRRLADVTDVVDRYLGTVLAATDQTVAERTDLVQRFLSAWAQARNHVLDPKNRPEVIALIGEQFSLTPNPAERFAAVLLDSRTGLVPNGEVSRKALGNVLELRRSQDGFNPSRTVADLLAPESGLVHYPEQGHSD